MSRNRCSAADQWCDSSAAKTAPLPAITFGCALLLGMLRQTSRARNHCFPTWHALMTAPWVTTSARSSTLCIPLRESKAACHCPALRSVPVAALCSTASGLNPVQRTLCSKATASLQRSCCPSKAMLLERVRRNCQKTSWAQERRGKVGRSVAPDIAGGVRAAPPQDSHQPNQGTLVIDLCCSGAAHGAPPHDRPRRVRIGMGGEPMVPALVSVCLSACLLSF
mmetsp:Transcript_107840/g.337672  ORF Transcript_107840/g.337672 Transcript_107840/m.337672 type:complete len:223 (+) Transcript_107840:452-1120(+)